jgi:hypothetical protein
MEEKQEHYITWDKAIEDYTATISVDAATGEFLDILAKVPTVQDILHSGTGLELDSLAEMLKLDIVRVDGETDESFRGRLREGYYN